MSNEQAHGSPRKAEMSGNDSATDEQISELAGLIDGCKNDARGCKAKQSIIMSHIRSTADTNLLDVLLALHQLRCITLRKEPLLTVLAWKDSKSSGDVGDATHPGFYLANTLSTCAVGDMPQVMNKFLEATPRVDVISVLRFIRKAGFISASDEALMSDDVVDWTKPSPDGKLSPDWHSIWSGVEGRELPLPGPMYVNVRDDIGRHACICFLGAHSETGALASPSKIVNVWKISPRPALCVKTDAGSMHPKHLDSINKMYHLPAFKEYVDKQRIAGDGSHMRVGTDGGNGEGGGDGSVQPASKWARAYAGVVKGQKVSIKDIVKKALESWNDEVPAFEADVYKDGSINNLLFTRVKDVFAALLDAVTLAGSAIIVDRTAGEGSATAEYLLELALECVACSPTPSHPSHLLAISTVAAARPPPCPPSLSCPPTARSPTRATQAVEHKTNDHRHRLPRTAR